MIQAGGGNKITEQIVDKRVTIFSDPQDPQLLGNPYDGQGFPLSRQVWIENGILKQLFYSRFWAQKQGKQPTGGPNSIKMEGGKTSMDEMIKSTPRGVLVTRLWYLRQVDPRVILYSLTVNNIAFSADSNIENCSTNSAGLCGVPDFTESFRM